MSNSERINLYTFKVYPEHLGYEPLETIKECLNGYSFAVSPLHSEDVNNNGNLKKPHYHINISFRSPITHSSAVSKICDAFKKYGGDIVGNFTGIDSVQAARGKQRALDRYLCHLDHPNKAQYDKDEIYCSSLYRLDLSDNNHSLLSECLNIIDTLSIYSFSFFVTYLRKAGKIDELNYVVKHTYFFKTILEP